MSWLARIYVSLLLLHLKILKCERGSWYCPRWLQPAIWAEFHRRKAKEQEPDMGKPGILYWSKKP